MEEQSKTVLPNTQINLIDEDGEVIASQISNDKGEYNFDVQPVENYTIVAAKEGYSDYSLPFVSSVGRSNSNIELKQKKVEIIEKMIVIENIYFDFDKANIKSESTLSLNKILDVLNENPTMKIRINSHTDSRGSSRYNLVLSEKEHRKPNNILSIKESTKIVWRLKVMEKPNQLQIVVQTVLKKNLTPTDEVNLSSNNSKLA